MEANLPVRNFFSSVCSEKEITHNDVIRLLGQDAVLILVTAGVLQETAPLKHDPDTGLEIYVDRGEVFVIPDEDPFSERQIIDPGRLRNYVVCLANMMERLGKALHLQGDLTEHSVGRLWTLGSRRLGAAKVWCVTCIGELQAGDMHLLRVLVDGGSHVVLFSSAVNPLGGIEPPENLHVRQLADSFLIKQGKLIADPEGMLQTEIAMLGRDVQFDKKTGLAIYMGSRLGRLEPETPEYWMFSLLFERYGQRVTHQHIIDFILKKGIPKRDIDVATWSNKIKSSIADILGRTTVDKFLKSSREKGAYILG